MNNNDKECNKCGRTSNVVNLSQECPFCDLPFISKEEICKCQCHPLPRGTTCSLVCEHCSKEETKRNCCKNCFLKTPSGLIHCTNIAFCPCHTSKEEVDPWEVQFNKKFGIFSNYADFCPDKEVYKSFIRQLLATHERSLVEKIESIYTLLVKEQIELCNGKLPYVFFEGKATEEETVQIYRVALEDFRKHIYKLIQNK